MPLLGGQELMPKVEGYEGNKLLLKNLGLSISKATENASQTEAVIS